MTNLFRAWSGASGQAERRQAENAILEREGELIRDVSDLERQVAEVSARLVRASARLAEFEGCKREHGFP